MGFVSEVLDGVNGIKWFYIVGILIFVALFIVIVIRTVRIPKKDLNAFKNSILDQDENNNNNTLYQSE